MSFRDRVIELRRIRACDIKPNPRNWRTHPEKQRKAFRAVLSEVGFAGVELVYASERNGGALTLIDGHMRQDEAGEAEIPCAVLDVTDAEADKLLATFDPLASMAKPDAEKLDGLLREIETGSEDLAAMLADIAKQAGCEWSKTGEVVEDEAQEPPSDPVTKPGDLWLLGEHRLLCGDSTKAEDVERLMGGNRASCVFTDPPYGVSQAKKNRLLNESANGRWGNAKRNETDIIDDDLTPVELEAKLLPAFVNIRERVMSDDCTLFVTAPQGGELGMMMMMMMKAGLLVRHVLIWKKNQPTFSMGRLDYDYAHEPILLTWLKRHKRPMAGKHKTSVWEVDKPRKSEEHPTMKPVELYANAYLNNSDDGDSVADLYGGSGTAIIAAEQLNRCCFAMEISPAYCDVAVSRWEKFTGNSAVLENSA